VVADPEGDWEPSTAEEYIDQQIGIEASTRLAQDNYIQSQIPLADEEDITKNESYLKFKDRTYNQVSPNGMGRVILRNNIVNGVNTLTQSMIQATNTIYVIQYDFTLTQDITVPANCVLEFDGGSLSGNSIITLNSTIIGGVPLINVNCIGTVENINIEQTWFDGVDRFIGFINNVSGFEVINFKDGNYEATLLLNKSVNRSIVINGNGATITYKTYDSNNRKYWQISSEDEIVLTQIIQNSPTKGTLDISVQNGTVFSVGDIIILKDNTTSSFSPYRDYQEGEYATVKAISGNTLTLAKPIYGNYTHSGSCTVSKIQLIDVEICNLTIKLDYDLQQNYAEGMIVKYSHFVIDNVEVSGFNDNASFCYCYGGIIQNCKSIAYNNVYTGVDNYGFTICNSQDIIVSGGLYSGGNHGLAIGGYYTGYNTIVNRNITVDSVSAHSNRYVYGIDCHGNSQFVTFRDCKSNGINAGGSHIRIYGCDITYDINFAEILDANVVVDSNKTGGITANYNPENSSYNAYNRDLNNYTQNSEAEIFEISNNKINYISTEQKINFFNYYKPIQINVCNNVYTKGYNSKYSLNFSSKGEDGSVVRVEGNYFEDIELRVIAYTVFIENNKVENSSTTFFFYKNFGDNGNYNELKKFVIRNNYIVGPYFAISISGKFDGDGSTELLCESNVLKTSETPGSRALIYMNYTGSNAKHTKVLYTNNTILSDNAISNAYFNLIYASILFIGGNVNYDTTLGTNIQTMDAEIHADTRVVI